MQTAKQIRASFYTASFALFLFAIQIPAAAQTSQLQFDPAHTEVRFTLGAALHTVHGSFQLKQGSVEFDPASGKVVGEIVVDAKSAQSGNSSRDRKMHRDVLESERFSEIVFHPDRVEGLVPHEGKATVQIHGLLNIHGADHELTVPADVEISADHWTTTVHFAVPYVEWGMKNPSTLFLRVSDSVQIDVVASGTLNQQSSRAASLPQR